MKSKDISRGGAVLEGRKRLGDLINANGRLIAILGTKCLLQQMHYATVTQSGSQANAPIGDQNKAELQMMIRIWKAHAQIFDWHTVLASIRRLEDALFSTPINSEINYALRSIQDAYEDATCNTHLYFYKPDKAKILREFRQDWSAALTAFPSSDKDVESGVDLYCMDHPAASIFHMMRVLEVDLRVLSLDLEIRYSQKNWQNIIDEIVKGRFQF